MSECIALSDLGIGQKAKIENFEESKIPIKLLEMGVLPETEIMILSKAPMQGPYLIQYGNEGSRLSLRKEEASGILISIKK